MEITPSPDGGGIRLKRGGIEKSEEELTIENGGGNEITVRSELPAEPTPEKVDQGRFVLLFNGKDKTGWREATNNEGEWEVRGGILEGRGGVPTGAARLISERHDYSNFRLRVRVLNSERHVKQIMIRRSATENTHSGYRIAVGGTDTWQNTTIPVGSINKAVDQPFSVPIPWNVGAEPIPIAIGEWYTLEISAIGRSITTSVNGRKVAEYTDGLGSFKSGEIALLCGTAASIQYKEILLEELPD